MSESGVWKKGKNGKMTPAEDEESPFRREDELTPLYPMRLEEPTNPWGFAFMAIKTFGFPTLVAAALGWWVYHSEQLNRTDRITTQAAFVEALGKNTEAVSGMKGELHDMNTKLEDHLKYDESAARTRR